MRTLIMPYKKGSASATGLAKALGIRQVRLEGSTLKGSMNIKLINWGSSNFHDNPEFAKCDVINHPEVTSLYSDKLKFFQRVEQELTVPWTTDHNTVKEWLAQGCRVFARRVLNGHSGIGIVDMGPENLDNWVNAPLYTLYVPKKHEYRFHFLGGRVIDQQRKGYLKDPENAPPNPEVFRIRNLANGFVFARNFGETPDVVNLVVTNFLATNKELDFGALDVIYNEKAKKAYILEVNTAPGLKGTTLDCYANAFKEFLQ